MQPAAPSVVLGQGAVYVPVFPAVFFFPRLRLLGLALLDRAIDLPITRLRRKIEKDAAHPEAIRTVRGVRYMFVPPKD